MKNAKKYNYILIFLFSFKVLFDVSFQGNLEKWLIVVANI